MKNAQLRFLTNERIEEVTAQRIRQYEAKAGQVVRFPVPAEVIVETVLGLNLLWDTIDEEPGETILAGLNRRTRTIVMNESHQDLFETNPGLRNSTIVHEAGHADLEGGLGEPGRSLFDEGEDCLVHRHARKADEKIAVLYKLALKNEKVYRLLRKMNEGQDTPEQKSAVDRYQSAFLMPEWLLRDAGQRYDLTHWPDLYRLKDEVEVSISNLVTRLKRLELIFIPRDSKKIYRHKDEFTGQKSLF